MPMIREFKGKSIATVLNDYVAIDIETTGLDVECDDIIELAAIRYVNGKQTDVFTSLVNPGYEIDSFISELTGITNEELFEAPEIESILPAFLDFVGDHTLVGHNINFDINFIYDNAARIGRCLKNDFVDTLRMSRRAVPDLCNHQLKTLVQHFGLASDRAHRAKADAEMAALIYQECIRIFKKNDVNVEKIYDKKKNYSAHGVNASDIKPTVDEFDEDHPLFGKVCVFTGTLSSMTRREAMQATVNCGGDVGDRITKETNYLILANDNYQTRTGEKSSKQKKAEEYKLLGYGVDVISERTFLDMLESQNGYSLCDEKQSSSSEDKTEESVSSSVYSDEDILSVVLPLVGGDYLLNGKVIIRANKTPPNSIVFIASPSQYRSDTGDVLLCKVKTNGKHEKRFIQFSTSCTAELRDLELQFIGTSSAPRVSIESFVSLCERKPDEARRLIHNILSSGFSFDRFDCCSRYKECSKAKKCVHPDLIYATACGYRRSLEKGKVFF